MWLMKEDGAILPLEHYIAPVNVEEMTTSSIQLYPNPGHDLVYVLSNGQFLDIPSEYQVFDAVGHQVLSGQWQGRLDINQLSQGVYCLRLNGQSIQFIKN